jgi:hypothetical protein
MKRRGAADLMAIVLVVLFLGAAGSGVFAYLQHEEAARLSRTLDQAGNDYKQCIKLRDELRDIKLTGGNVGESETDTIQTFFHETSKEHKFTINKITPSKTRYRETWDEQSYRLEIKNVSRQQLGNFVADVELKKPFLKSKEIRDIRFDENHFIQSAVVVFSHYTRLRK